MPSLFDQAAPAQQGPAPNPLASEINDNLKRQGNGGSLENPAGVGTEPASEEENQKLEVILTGIERQIHGPHRDKILDMLDSTPELWMNVALSSQTLLEGAHQKLAEQGMDLEPDFWFGENGIIQSTVEMVYELAVAADTVNSNDSNQLDAAYMKTIQMVGEELFETDDAAAAEAQQMMLDLEFGEGATDLAAEGFELGGNVDDLLGDELAEEVGPTTAVRPSAENLMFDSQNGGF